MENRRFLHRQRCILRIEFADILFAERCVRVCIASHIDDAFLLCQQIQRIDINIAIDQDDFLISFLNNGNQQTESIAIPCSVKAYGRYLRPPLPFEVTICDLKQFFEVPNWNLKSF